MSGQIEQGFDFIDEDIEQIVSYASDRFVEDAENGANPPFGLVERRGLTGILGKPKPVTAFDTHDPFGYLGKTVGDTLGVISHELEGQVPASAIRHAHGNYYPGSIMMGYLLAMVPKVYGRELPEEVPSPTDLAAIARASYLDIVKKFAAHSKVVAQAHISQNLAVRQSATPIGVMDYYSNFPMASNPFSDRHFALVRTADGHKLANPTFQAAPWEAELPICPSAKVIVKSGQLALKLVWNRMVDLAEQNHYADPAALTWAQK